MRLPEGGLPAREYFKLGGVMREELFLINPGSGPVRGRTTLKDAWKNIRALRREAGLLGKVDVARVCDDDNEGRYGFRLRTWSNLRRFCDVQMPGCALAVLKAPTGLPPRVLVGEFGSSWMWKFAIPACLDELMTMGVGAA